MEFVDYRLIHQNKLDNFFEKAFESCGFSYEPDGKHNDLRNIKIVFADAGGGFWGLLQNGLVIGTAGLKVLDNLKSIGELKCMYILPEFQGKGLGQLLIDKIVLESKKIKLKRIRLDVRTKADRAINLYRKNGFYEIPKYNDNINDVLFMEKIIE